MERLFRWIGHKFVKLQTAIAGVVQETPKALTAADVQEMVRSTLADMGPAKWTDISKKE